MTENINEITTSIHSYVLAINQEVYNICGGVSGNKAFIVKDRNGFTTELNKKYIKAGATTDEILEAGLTPEKYFEDELPEFYV